MKEIKMDLQVADKVRLLTVFDNYEFDDSLQTGWGFSCLVEVNDTKVLFDTGADGPVLLANMTKPGLSPSEIDAVVLSHPHFDHTGGLAALEAQNNDIKVFGHTGFGTGFKSAMESRGASYVEASSPRTITASSAVTGPVGTGLTEQAFFVSTPEGLVVITGCAHPGVVRMAQAAKESTGEEIHLVLGGFHLGGASQAQLEDTAKELQELGVDKAAPCHCSGDACRRVFSKVFGDNYVENGTGRRIQIP